VSSSSVLQRALSCANSADGSIQAVVINRIAVTSPLLTFPKEYLRMIVDKGGYFFNLEEKIQCSQLSPLQCLAYTYRCSCGSHLEMISFLLSRGASVTSRDGFGRTCLHLLPDGYKCVTCPASVPGIPAEAFKRFIKAGADVFAKENHGHSVSEFAYRLGYGKLWEEVLVDCGLDPVVVCGESYQRYDLHMYNDGNYLDYRVGQWNMEHK